MLAFALGLIAKQMLVTLPFVLILMDYWPLQRFTLAPAVTTPKRRSRKAAIRKSSLPAPNEIKTAHSTSFSRCFLEKLPLLALSAVASLIIFLIQSEATLVKRIPLVYRLGNALVAYAKYIVKMLWPVDLGILYPHPKTNLPLFHAVAAACLLLGVSIVVIRFSRSRRWLIVGWLWFIGTLIPVIGLVQVGLQAMADRYTYVPLIGLFIIIAWGTADLAEKLKSKFRTSNIVFTTVVVIVLSVLTVITSLQLSRWKNSIVLYEHTVAVTADNHILHYNLGQLLLDKGETEHTIEHWRNAIRIKPDQPIIHRNLAVLLGQQGKFDEAINHYRQVLKYKPTDTVVREALKNLLAWQKKLKTIESKNPVK
jgi:tetratricopeptide (TPR) repeat protein